MKWIFLIFDALHLPRIFEIIWHIPARVSRLSQYEIDAALLVFGTNAIQYDSIRVAEDRLLKFIFRLNKRRAFTTFNTINLPSSGSNSRPHLDIVVHELTHVCQYRLMGSIYIWQALRAQRTTGYKYGGWLQLVEDRNNGKHFRDYNREQQGQIAQDYYNEVIIKDLLAENPIHQAYEPFIDELRNREL